MNADNEEDLESAEEGQRELRFKPGAFAAVISHVEGAFPEEGCGVLLGRGQAKNKRVEEALGLPNVAALDRAARYEIDPLSILRLDKAAAEKGLAILGFFHSHPIGGAIPSATDLAAAWEGYEYVIVPTVGGIAGRARRWFFYRGEFVEGPLNCD